MNKGGRSVTVHASKPQVPICCRRKAGVVTLTASTAKGEQEASYEQFHFPGEDLNRYFSASWITLLYALRGRKNVDLVREAEDRSWYAANEPKLRLQFLRIPPIVGIEHGDELSPCHGDSQVAGSSFAEILGISDILDARIFTRELRDDVRRIIYGCIVDDNAFPILKRLSLHAVNGIGQIMGIVVGCDHNADHWWSIRGTGRRKNHGE